MLKSRRGTQKLLSQEQKFHRTLAIALAAVIFIPQDFIS
jgi:hypothetical protein